METRVAIIGIIIENLDSVEPLNALLHKYNQYVISRTGIPYRERGVSIISLVVDAPNDVISTLSGKAGLLPGVTAKAVYSKLPEKKE